MNVYLTFDIEIWCPGWKNLDRDFPNSYPRYLYGRSKHGDYGLPKTLEILDKHKLHGVFFVEPLFAARFGLEYLSAIVDMIKSAGQEIQLHLHPEWTDEITPPPLPNITRKRPLLSQYSLDEQTHLIGFALDLLKQAGVEQVTAFRAGTFSANIDTFAAVKNNNILIDSSFNMEMDVSGPDLRKEQSFFTPFEREGVRCYPMSVFTDGTGHHRHAQLGACSFLEMKQALASAFDLGWSDFVILSHNFEMLRVGGNEPDQIVVKRFENLCDFLSANAERYHVTGWDNPSHSVTPELPSDLPKTSLISTLVRYGEQAIRRVI